MRFKMMAVATVAALAIPAFAQTMPATDAPAPKPVKEKKICRREGPATGSILGAPAICRTKAEWATIDKANADAVDRVRNNQNGRFGTDSSGALVAH